MKFSQYLACILIAILGAGLLSDYVHSLGIAFCMWSIISAIYFSTQKND